MVSGISFGLSAQTLTEKIQTVVSDFAPKDMSISKIRVIDVTDDTDNGVLNVDVNETFAYLPLNAEKIEKLKADILSVAGEDYKEYKAVKLTINKVDIAEYLDATTGEMKYMHAPFVTHLNQPDTFTKGLNVNVLAIWQSHGLYFMNKLNRWDWQRPRLFGIVEDLFTQSFVMPFLMPMLENAGAYVFSPRERDLNTTEIIINNDNNAVSSSKYVEHNGKNKWKTSKGKGFGYCGSPLKDNQNPFTQGTCREVKTVTDIHKQSIAQWQAHIPQTGTYAVYISYKSSEKSADDAVYTIHHRGGEDSYKVNQQMGGGTWIYLGHFELAEGEQTIVTLSNCSQKANAIISADAVKIGGGMGNVARSMKVGDDDASNYSTSGYPRFCEGARYWMQWAGVPDSIYSPQKGTDDYKDDYICRGSWVNYLAGGSSVLPKRKGLNIPVDLALGFHTDSSKKSGNNIVGTLGIFYTNHLSKYENGVSRLKSRELTDLIMTNICHDIRADFEPNWKRRALYDKSYFEARVPEVPTMLLELLSHLNFADMRYGLDPSFRFEVCRAVYKGILQFIAKRDNRDYVVQPLPVNAFAINQAEDNSFTLSWSETQDHNCDNARPSHYYIYERIDDGAFRRIATTDTTTYSLKIEDHHIHSYKITAVNDGGESFPSEILALGLSDKSRGTVLVINGFTRVSAPASFTSGTGAEERAGFDYEADHGVPYIQDICYVGAQTEFQRNKEWSNDAPGFGASDAGYEAKVIAGNTFDYPYMHGRSLKEAGYSFVSCSRDAVEKGLVDMTKYKCADLILGKQKTTVIGRGAVANRYQAYTPQLMNALKAFTANGGNLLISGEYVATELCSDGDSEKKTFAESVLGVKWITDRACTSGKLFTMPTTGNTFPVGKYYNYSNTLNEKIYTVESPDGIKSSDKSGQNFMLYYPSNISAAVISNRTNYKTCVLGFPFESLRDSAQRNSLMSQIMNFLNQ